MFLSGLCGSNLPWVSAAGRGYMITDGGRDQRCFGEECPHGYGVFLMNAVFGGDAGFLL